MAMDVLHKVPVREQDPKVRATNFEEVCYGYNEEEAKLEAARCIDCKKPLCVQGCPVNIDIPGFIREVKNGNYEEAAKIALPVLEAFSKGEFDKAEIVSSYFVSAISRDVQARPLLPVELPETEAGAEPVNRVKNAFYDYEPDKLSMLSGLLPQIAKAQVFNAIAQAQASEQGARMASMDNATHNASDMISELTLRYNGIRQSAITTELTEIISGAEAI